MDKDTDAATYARGLKEREIKAAVRVESSASILLPPSKFELLGRTENVLIKRQVGRKVKSRVNCHDRLIIHGKISELIPIVKENVETILSLL